MEELGKVQGVGHDLCKMRLAVHSAVFPFTCDGLLQRGWLGVINEALVMVDNHAMITKIGSQCRRGVGDRSDLHEGSDGGFGDKLKGKFSFLGNKYVRLLVLYCRLIKGKESDCAFQPQKPNHHFQSVRKAAA